MKYLSYIRYFLLAASALIVFLYFFTGNEMFVDLMLKWAYGMLFLTIACAVILPVINLVKNPKTALRSLVGLGIVVVVIGVSYAMSSGAQLTAASGDIFTNETALRLSDTGLYTTYVAMFAAIVSIVVCEIASIFR